MKQLTSITKLIATNIFLLLIFVWTLNFLSAVVIDSVYLLKKIFVPITQTLYAESLPDQESAHLIFRELRQLTKQYVPYMAWARKPFSGVTTNINETDGERITPQSSDNSPKHVRFFGGSSMWGTGVDDHNTIPAHFHTLDPDSRVYNHAQSGFVSRQELARLINLVNQNSPMNIVVFYDGCNDPLTLCRTDVSINGHREQSKIARKLDHRWKVPEALAGSTQTAIRQIFKKGKRTVSRCQDNPVYAEKVASTIVSNWKIAKHIAELQGAEFHAILQPVLSIGSPNTEYVTETIDGSDWLAVYPLLRAIKERENLTWIHDFSDAFDGTEYIYIDSCHVNSRGNQIIAERLSQILYRHDTAS